MEKDILYILLCGISLGISGLLMWLQYRVSRDEKETNGLFRVSIFLNTFMFVFSINRIESVWYKALIFAVALILAISSMFILARIECRKTKTNTAYWKAGAVSILLFLLSLLIYKELIIRT